MSTYARTANKGCLPASTLICTVNYNLDAIVIIQKLVFIPSLPPTVRTYDLLNATDYKIHAYVILKLYSGSRIILFCFCKKKTINNKVSSFSCGGQSYIITPVVICKHTLMLANRYADRDVEMHLSLRTQTRAQFMFF